MATIYPPIYEGMLVQGEDQSSTKVFVVVYPSNEAATKFLPVTETEPEGYGIGICVVPRQKHGLKFWSKDAEPAVLSAEDMGQDGLTVRSGKRVGSIGILARFLVGQGDHEVQLSRYEKSIEQVLQPGSTAADSSWIKACLQVLQNESLVASFDIEDFISVMWRVVKQRAQDLSEMPFHVKDFDYLAYLANESERLATH